MTSKLTGFARDSAIYGIGEFSGRLGNLILIPILSRIFLPGEYGVIDLLNVTFIFALMITGLGLYTGFQKYYYIANGEERKILSTSTILFLVLISTSSAVLIIISAKFVSLLVFKKTNYYMAIALAATRLPIEMFYMGLMVLLRLKRRAVRFSIYNITQMILLPVGTYICVVSFDLGLEGVFVAPLMTFALLNLCCFFDQRHEFTRKIDFSKTMEVLKFSLPGHPAILIKNSMRFIPRYLLAYFSTLTAVGLFGLADRIARIVQMATTAFNQAWNPFAFSNAGKDDEKHLYEKVFKVFSGGLILLSMVLTLFAREILFILTPPSYHSAASMVGGLCLYFSIRALTAIFSTGMYSANKVGYTSLLGAVELFCFIISSIILIPYYQATGLIVALAFGALAYFVCYVITIKKYFSFNFSSHRILSLLTFAVTGYILFTFYITDNSFNTKIFISKINFIILHTIVTYFAIFGRDERRLIKNKIRCFYLLRPSV